MAKYNWTIDTLINKMKLIEKLISLETDEKKLLLLQTDYKNLQIYINSYFDRKPAEMLKLLENLEYIKDELTPMSFLWEEFYGFACIASKFIPTPRLKKCNLSKEELLTITHDFYKQLNHFFFGNFMKNFYQRKDHLAFRNYDPDSLFVGETITLPSLKESYIQILRRNTIDDALTTIHEYSHATSISINPQHLSNSKTLYTEIDSIFMELIASDYLDTTLNSHNAPIVKSNKINWISRCAENICIQIDLIKEDSKTINGFKNNKELKKAAFENCGLTPIKVEDILNHPDAFSTIYITSFIIALELYNIYQEDKERALYYLKKIIRLNNLSEEQYYNVIKKLGIIPNQSTKEFYKECQIDILKLTRKKSKPTK